MNDQRQFAIVTGASSGIGYELAAQCVNNGYDVLAVADDPAIAAAAARLGSGSVTPLEADLADPDGVARVWEAVGDRTVDALLANAGRSLPGRFVDQDVAEWRRVLDTNVTGTLLMIQRAASHMEARGRGRILITGSIAGFVPGAYQAIYNSSKSFLNSFSHALRQELAGTGVSVTCLLPGITDTMFFERAGIANTIMGHVLKDSPATVARRGFEAMTRGDAEVISGVHNKLQARLLQVLPVGLTAAVYGQAVKPRR